MIAGLITAAATAPISAFVAYNHHVEAMERLSIERMKQSQSSAHQVTRQKLEDRRAMCGQALIYLGDEKTNAALPAPERQVLLTDMRRTASSCMLPATGNGSGGNP